MPRSWNPWSTSVFSQDTEDTLTDGRASNVSEAGQLSQVGQLVEDQDQRQIDFITFLAIAQSLHIKFLPIPWLPAATKLGTGGTAEVRQAFLSGLSNFAFKRLTLGRTHTFRVLHSELAVSGHPAIRRHENITGLEGICWDVDADVNVIWPVLVFEKAAFGSLDRFLQSNAGQSLDASEKLKLLRDIVSGLLCLHSHGAIHGDVAPLNVLVSRSTDSGYVAKLADFGYASFVSDCELVSLAVQAPWTYYQYHGQPVTGQMARIFDIFSFGLLCGWFVLYDASDTKFQSPYEIIRELNCSNVDPLERFTTLLYDCVAFSLEQRDLLLKLLGTTLSWRTLEHHANPCSFVMSLLEFRRDSELYPTSFEVSTDTVDVLQTLTQDHVQSQMLRLPLFKISRSLFHLLNSDFRLLGHVHSQLEHQAASSNAIVIRRNAQFQLAVSCTLALSGRRDASAADTWLSMSDKEPADLDSEIDRIRTETDWKFGNKVNASIRADGVLDRLDMQLIESRPALLTSEKEYYEGVVTSLSKIFEPNHGLIILCRYKLANLLSERGQHSLAQHELLELLDLISNASSWGPLHPSTSVVRNQGTVLSFKLGEFALAEKLYLEALASQQTAPKSETNVTVDARPKYLSVDERDDEYSKPTIEEGNAFLPQQRESTKETGKTVQSEGGLDAMRTINESTASARELFQVAVDNFKRFYAQNDTGRSQAWSDDSILSTLSAGSDEDEDAVAEAMPEIAEWFESEHRDMFHLIGDLAIRLRGEGEIDEAMKISKLLLSQKHLIDNNDPYRLAVQSNLAAMLADDGHRQEALKMELDLLARRRAILGTEHPECMTAMRHIGAAYDLDGRHAEAKQMYEELLLQQRRSLGAEHIQTLLTVEHLAGIHLDTGDHKRAKDLYEQNLSVFSKQGEPLHPKALAMIRNLGLVNIRMGNYAEALDQGQQALQGMTELLRHSPLEILLSMDIVASALSCLGRTAEAEKFYLQALELGSRLEPRVEVLVLNHDYGLFLSRLGRYAEAETYYLEALELGSRYGFSLQALKVRRSYSWLLHTVGRYPEAEKCYLEGIDMMIASESHQHILLLKNDYAVLLFVLGRHMEAERYYLEALELETKPAFRKDVLTIRHNYGTLLYALDRFSEARDQIQAAWGERRQLLGEDHSDTLESSSIMARVLDALGESIESAPSLEDDNNGL